MKCAQLLALRNAWRTLHLFRFFSFSFSSSSLICCSTANVAQPKEQNCTFFVTAAASTVSHCRKEARVRL